MTEIVLPPMMTYIENNKNNNNNINTKRNLSPKRFPNHNEFFQHTSSLTTVESMLHRLESSNNNNKIQIVWEIENDYETIMEEQDCCPQKRICKARMLPEPSALIEEEEEEENDDDIEVECRRKRISKGRSLPKLDCSSRSLHNCDDDDDDENNENNEDQHRPQQQHQQQQQQRGLCCLLRRQNHMTIRETKLLQKQDNFRASNSSGKKNINIITSSPSLSKPLRKQPNFRRLSTSSSPSSLKRTSSLRKQASATRGRWSC